MNYRYILIYTQAFLALLIIICILSQKSEGSSFVANTNFKARGAKSIINAVIGVLFSIFCIVSIALGVNIKNEVKFFKNIIENAKKEVKK